MFKDDTEKYYVIDFLTGTIAGLEKPREVLTSNFAGTNFAQKLGQGLPGQLVQEAVHICLGDAWNNDPPWLWLLLYPYRTTDAKIAEILERIKIKPMTAPDPLDSTILNDGTPFIDRAPLRFHLRRLATPASNLKPIFVVTGNDKSGKSYSAKYIEHFSSIQQSIISNKIEFDPELGLELGAQEVARRLVSAMGRPLSAMPTPTTNQKLYSQQLASWVLNEAVQTSWQNWFVLDNFRGDTLRQDTRELLTALSSEITNGIFPHRCRLILIAFDRALLRVDPGRVEEESIGPCPKTEVKLAIEEILKRAPVVLSADFISSFIFTGLPADKSKMTELNSRLRVLLYAVTQVRKVHEQVPEADYQALLQKMLEDLPAGERALEEVRMRIEDLFQSTQEL